MIQKCKENQGQDSNDFELKMFFFYKKSLILTVNSLRIFLCHFPTPEIIIFDHGPEIFLKLSQEFQQYGMEHRGYIERRLTQQGSAEKQIQLLKSLMNKVCELAKFNGRKYWDLSLPIILNTLNCTNPYESPLSRRALIFSPF